MGEGVEVGKISEDGQKIQTSVIRELSPEDVTYSLVTNINNTILYI